jgi:hypothetical protein
MIIVLCEFRGMPGVNSYLHLCTIYVNTSACHNRDRNHLYAKTQQYGSPSRLGGVVVSVLATGPKGYKL